MAHGGAGDSSVLTAYGVFQGMRAAAEVVWGEPTLAGRTVGVAGVGKVGHHLVRLLVEDGASIIATDVSPAAIARAAAEHPASVRVVGNSRAAGRPPSIDVYAPCALGGALTDEVVDVLTAKIVCGAANNQLAHPGVEKMLEDRGILYAPGLLRELRRRHPGRRRAHGFNFERAKQRAAGIFDTTREVFQPRRRRRRRPRHRRRPPRRAPDARRRPPPRRLAPWRVGVEVPGGPGVSALLGR